MYDATVRPDERSNPRRYPLPPPDSRAIYREFVSRAGEARRYIFALESRPGSPLQIPPATRQLREAEGHPFSCSPEVGYVRKNSAKTAAIAAMTAAITLTSDACLRSQDSLRFKYI